MDVANGKSSPTGFLSGIVTWLLKMISFTHPLHMPRITINVITEFAYMEVGADDGDVDGSRDGIMDGAILLDGAGDVNGS